MVWRKADEGGTASLAFQTVDVASLEGANRIGEVGSR